MTDLEQMVNNYVDSGNADDYAIDLLKEQQAEIQRLKSKQVRLRNPKDLNHALASGEIKEGDRIYTVNILRQQCFSWINYDVEDGLWRFRTPNFQFKTGTNLSFEDLLGWLPETSLPAKMEE